MTQLVSWGFNLIQPKRIISGLRETFIKIYIELKEELRPEGQSEKAESCRENLWNETQLKGLYKDGDKRMNRINRSGQARLVYVFDVNHNIPTT